MNTKSNIRKHDNIIMFPRTQEQSTIHNSAMAGDACVMCEYATCVIAQENAEGKTRQWDLPGSLIE